MDDTITIRNLSKTYGKGRSKFTALNDINLSIGKGMFGLLGPNGAGKTTMMKILATLLKPSTGSVSVFGYDLKKDRKHIRRILGYLPQEFGAYAKLYPNEFLDYIARLNGIRDRKKRSNAVDQIMNLTNLMDLTDRKIHTFSGGMVRRLGIAQALIGTPKLLIVDEPTTGLDPEERIRFRNLLSEISSKVSIILSTHIVNDISSTCNNLAILNLGNIVFEDHPEKLLAQAQDKTWILKIEHEELSSVKESISIISLIMQTDHVEVRVVADEVSGFDAEQVEPSLEDAYIYFMEILSGTKLHEFEELHKAS